MSVDGLIYLLLIGVVVAWWFVPRITVLLLGALIVVGTTGWLDHRWQAGLAVVTGIVLLIAHALRKPERTPWVSGILAVVLCGVSAWLLYLFPVRALPAPSGSEAVGVRDFVLADHSRLGVLADEADAPRQLLVRVWYPAEGAEGTPRSYFTQMEAETTATGLGGIIGAPFFLQYLKHVDTNSVVDAPLKPAPEPRPVIVYSHGYTAFAGQNTSLMETLASHGYLVFSVQHTYDSSQPVFPDGTSPPVDEALIEALLQDVNTDVTAEVLEAFAGQTPDVRRRAQLARIQRSVDEGRRIATVSAPIWLADRIFVLNALASGAVPETVADVVAAGAYDATGQMGMSFGGSTTGGFCMVDERCAAAVNLDGGDYHRTTFNANLPVPFMMMYSDFQQAAERLAGHADIEAHAFNEFSYERHEVAGLRDDVYRFVVRNVAHLGYSDFSYFMRNPVRAPMLGALDGMTMLTIQNDFVLGFFDKHLRRMDRDFPSVELATHADHVWVRDVSALRAWWPEVEPLDRVELVRLETGLGAIDISVYAERAPVSAANFLAYIDQGLYDGASLYRATRRAKGSAIEVVQGGLLANTMVGDGDEYAQAEPPLGGIAHETTHKTGIANVMGTVAYARLAPGTAGSEIFFNLQDNPVLNTDTGGEGRDGFGYATFGRVVRGMDVLRQVQKMPADAPAALDILQGQVLDNPVAIERAYRLEGM